MPRHSFSPIDCHGRAWVAADLLASAIARGLPHTALIAARMAARSTLLALAERPVRRSGDDIALLREVAAAPTGDPAALSVEETARLRATLAAVESLLPARTSHDAGRQEGWP